MKGLELTARDIGKAHEEIASAARATDDELAYHALRKCRMRLSSALDDLDDLLENRPPPKCDRCKVEDASDELQVTNLCLRCFLASVRI